MNATSMRTYTVTGPLTITERDVQAPTEDELRDGQVLLRVLVGGICGSDLPYFKGMVMPYPDLVDGKPVPPPGSPMHEVVGEVIASRDPELKVGSNVVGWASSINAMSEYIIGNGYDLYAYDPSLSPSVAIMLQPLACVEYAVDVLQDVPGKCVAVIGQGSTGVLFSHVIKCRKAAHVTGIDRVDRSDVASTFGNDEFFWGTSDSWATSVANSGERPDIVVEAVGHQVSTLVDATNALADGGQIYYFGIPNDPIYPFPMMKFLRTCGRLYSGYTPVTVRRECLHRAGEHLAAHPELAEPYLSRTFKFAQAQEAFSAAISPRPGQLKVTLEG